MSRKLAVITFFTLLILASHDRAATQTIGRSFGPGGGIGLSPVGPLGGIGNTPNPLDISTDSITPNLNSTLPVIQTPVLELPPGSNSTVGATVDTDPERRDTPVTPVDSSTSSVRDVRQNLTEVNEDDTLQQQAVVVTGSPPDNEDEDDDDNEDEGDIPWWVWLLCVVGVAVVLGWLSD
jgi:hypothetical protein